MAFTVKTFYPSEAVEDVFTALFVVLALRSFEYVIKTLLTSSGPATVSTASYAFQIAVDQAFNPLNYLSWAKGKPDFGDQSTHSEPWRRPIPVPRATTAILVAGMVLFLEASFFYGSLKISIPLTSKQLRLATRLVNEPQGTNNKINSCAPVQFDSGRAELTAVFAVCNLQSGSRNMTGTITTRLIQTMHSLGYEVEGVGGKARSVTSFTLLLPERVDNMVVELHGELETNSTRALHNYYKDRKCKFNLTDDIGGQVLRDCEKELDVGKMVNLIVDFVKVEQGNDITPGRIGMPSDYYVKIEGGDVVVGKIKRQRITAVAVLVLSLTLFGVSIACFAFVKNDTAEVIAAVLREKTGQDFFTPAVSMVDAQIRVVRTEPESSGGTPYKIVHDKHT